MNLRRLYYKYKKIKNEKNTRKYTKLSSKSIYSDSFNVDLRNPEDRIYLYVGDDCLLNGSYIFEDKSGEINIGNRVFIGGGTQLISRERITIEDDVLISWGCLIYDDNAHSIYWEDRKIEYMEHFECVKNGGDIFKIRKWRGVESAPIRICSKSWVGTGCKIMKGVTIGEGAIVAAGSVVTRDVEPWTVVGGNPARFIKRIDPQISENKVNEFN